MEDETIIRLYNDRDEAAISQTDKKYGGYCRTISYNILQNRLDTEECVNDAYLHTWNAIPPKQPRNLKAFVGRIVRNLSLNRLEERRASKRGGGRYQAAYNELDRSLAYAAAPDTLGEIELRDLLNRFLAALPEERRNTFIGRYWYFQPIAEIATQTGFTQSKVKMQLKQSRDELREYLQKEGVMV